MLGKVFDYVAALPLENTAVLSFQEVVLCGLWLEHRTERSPERTVAAVKAHVDAWLKAPPTQSEPTEGRRCQLLLRGLVRDLQEGRLDELKPDEVEYLCKSFELSKLDTTAVSLSRVADILQPYARRLTQKLSAHPEARGMANLAERVEIVLDEEIVAAPTKSSRLLAGIELPCRGPVLSFDRDVQVIGDVPENCTLISTKGSCSVSGYVMGRVLTHQHCEVRGNIAGVVIAMLGDIRARSIITNAQVVTKAGNVICRSAERPALIFARERILITESTLLGRFVAQVIAIAQNVRGGEIHVSNMLRANYFSNAEAEPLSIVLRRDLRCEDYGEAPNSDLNKMLSEAYHLRQLAQDFESVARVNGEQAEQTAASILMYLFGGGDMQRQLAEIVSAQRRLNVANRIIATLEGAIEKAQDDFYRPSSRQATSGTGLSRAELDLLKEEDDSMGEDLAEQAEAVEAITSNLTSKKLGRAQILEVIQEARQNVTRFTAERERLKGFIAEREGLLRKVGGYDRVLASAGEDASKLKVLQRVLPSLRKLDPKVPMAARTRSVFFERSMRTLTASLRHAKDYKERAEEFHANFKTVNARLGEEFQVRVLDSQATRNSVVRAIGRFDAGVRLFVDLEAFEAETPPEGTCIVTENTGDAIHVFSRPRDSERFYSLHDSPRAEG